MHLPEAPPPPHCASTHPPPDSNRPTVAPAAASQPLKTRAPRPHSAPARIPFCPPPLYPACPKTTPSTHPQAARTNDIDNTDTHTMSPPPTLSPAPTRSTCSWSHLPLDIRLLIQSNLHLRDAFALAEACPHPAQRHQLRRRIASLRHLRKSWVEAAQPALRSYANPAHLCTRSARSAVTPTDFSSLTTLPLAASGLTTLHGISELHSLRVLDASRNTLTAVDDGLAVCANLRVLHLGWNALSSFPHVVMRLPQLRTLLLHHNRIQTLPHTWDRLPHLYRLGLFDCAIRDPLPEQLCRMLGTQTEQRRCRSANLQRNLIDHAVMTQILAKFPHLASAIVF